MRISDWSSDVCSSDLSRVAKLSQQYRPRRRWLPFRYPDQPTKNSLNSQVNILENPQPLGNVARGFPAVRAPEESLRRTFNGSGPALCGPGDNTAVDFGIALAYLAPKSVV